MSAPQPRQRTARRLRLGGELRELRRERELKQSDVCDALDLSPAMMSRIETGRVKIDTGTLNAMLDLYGGIGEARRGALVRLAEESERRGWHTAYGDVCPTAFPGVEDEAEYMWVWDERLPTGLLQTGAYARALISGSARDRQAADRRLEVRNLRRAVLDRENPPVLEAFLGEPALLWQVGGPRVLREQLHELLDITARRPNVTVRVVPFEAGAHYGLDGPLTIFRFGDGTEMGYTETGLGGAVYFESVADLEETYARKNNIESAALSVEDSAAMIKEFADRIRE